MSELDPTSALENYLSDPELATLLSGYRNVVVVGVSNKEDRPSNGVARYLMENTSLAVYFVNPLLQELWGRKVYASLTELKSELGIDIDIVDIVRKSEDIPPTADEAIELGAKMIWLQLGIVNNLAAQAARNAFMAVVQNKCIKIEYEKFYQRGLLMRPTK